jgi:peptide/nickel transport system substrate-binding protein
MDDTPDKDQTISPDPPIADSENSPSENINVRTKASVSPETPSSTISPDTPDMPAETHPQTPIQPIVSKHGGGKKRWLTLLLLVLVIVALAGGGWYFYQQNKDKNNAAKTASQSKDIQLMKIGMYQADFGGLYPDMSLSEYSFIVNAQMFEGLVRYEDKSKIVPALASNWTNPDSSTWVFTVKDGIKFHDGNTLTAKDVKYSLDTMIAKTDSDISQTFADTIKSVEVIDAKKVKITTKVPDSALLNKLNFLYIIDSNAPKGSEPSLAGTGPYQIKTGTKPTATNVQMTAFNGYHGGQPSTRAIDFGSNENADELIGGLKSHKYNLIGPNLPSKNAQALSFAKQYAVTEADVAYIGLNTVKAGPLQNKLVREAIRYAVNPTEIGKSDSSIVTPLSQLIPESIPGYNPAIPQYKQNVAKAKELLAQAGYPNGLTLRYSTGDTPAKAGEIVKELKQAGITATLDLHTDFDEFINYFTDGKAEMYDIVYTSDTLDGLDIYESNLLPAYYANSAVNTLLSQASATTDASKRLKQLQDVATIVNQDIPVVPLNTQDDIYYTDKDYVIRQDMPSSLMSVYFYKVREK